MPDPGDPRGALAVWLERIERAHPLQIDLGLERVAAVAARMGLDAAGPAPAIVVAGTNGKGSCVAVLEHLLHAGGARVGSYTSPHLRRYTERVRIDGREVDEAALCEAFAEVERARGATPLTYFEFGTLAALVVFRDARLDRVVLEVGLGGRLDAVNIVDAEVAVITSIQIDHTDWLGTDRGSIAREKAGILRAGRPAVIGERDPPASLREVAAERGARWFGIGTAFDAALDGAGRWSWRGSDLLSGTVQRNGLPAPRLHGDNVATALQALALCDALPEAGQLAEELPRIGLEGRYDRWRHAGVRCILDVAHNPAGMALLAMRLRQERGAGRTVVVFGAMRDKDLGAMLTALAPAASKWIFVNLPQPRAASARELAEALRAVADEGVAVECVSMAAAMESAFAGQGAADRVLVCGSFNTVGPALDWLEARGAVREECL